MLKLCVIGNLGKDPELRYTPNGQAVCDFSVAVNTGRDAQGDQQTTWVRVSCWDKKAEVAAEYLRKGSRVYVEGPPKVRTWEDDNGNARTSLEMTGYVLEFMSPKSEGVVGHEDRPAPAVRPAPAARPAPQRDESELDDLPF